MKRDKQSDKGVENYEGSPTQSENFVNFGPQTGQNGTGVFTHPPYILRFASLPGVAHGKRNPTKLCQTARGQ